MNSPRKNPFRKTALDAFIGALGDGSKPELLTPYPFWLKPLVIILLLVLIGWVLSMD
uniref:Uncharacterized protein n=1 Tax=uncultured Thiotrichaceae bacterium TaxID=298394 RepID=A0A6S6S7E1_9GAMM|nr:MAG: Unknown protein [uncultured Thiotrichaceae bacterium]